MILAVMTTLFQSPSLLAQELFRALLIIGRPIRIGGFGISTLLINGFFISMLMSALLRRLLLSFK